MFQSMKFYSEHLTIRFLLRYSCNDKYLNLVVVRYATVMLKFFMHRAAYCRVAVQLQLRRRNPRFSLFSTSLATRPFNNISPNFTRSFACSTSLVHKLRMCCILCPPSFPPPFHSPPASSTAATPYDLRR